MPIESILRRARTLEDRAAVHRALGDPVRLSIVDALCLSDRSPSDLCEALGLQSNLLAFHLDVLESVGLVRRQASQGDGRRRYVRLVGRAFELAVPSSPVPAAREVLFVCTHNAARSQLSAALWQRRTGRAGRSAGRAPARRIHPLARTVAREAGIDLSGRAPCGYDDVPVAPDLVVSVCDRAREAGLPFEAPAIHWSVPDPAKGSRAAFRAVLEELTERVEQLAAVTGDAA